ncbi:MAG TPA: DUF4136 domain-containing protein [Sphingomicrobium sp.]|jgi:hypothetical protein|nr:DUF4136 domain-containing protein [Sphingomicrobium sp.]
MRLHKFAAAAMLGVAALGLSACASSITSTVSRYQAMPAAQGQTFFVVPGGGMATNGGLEFQRYAGIVAQQLQARGYAPASNAQSATMLVQLGYGIDQGQVRYVEDPFYRSRFGYGYGSPFFYPRFGYRSRFSYGWDDPFWYGGYGGGVDSYVEYHSQIDLHIRARGSNAPLFDGRAQARSQTDRLDVVIPSLVEAMFTNFPGQNGETVKITIPTKPKS